MVQLIDFDRLDIIKLKENEVKTIRVDIVEDGLLDLPTSQLYDKLSTAVCSAMSTAAKFPIDNLWIEINIKDSTIDDDDSIYYLCANIIAANLLVGKMRDREPRLKIPSMLSSNGLFGLVWLKRMINEQLLCDRIGGVIKVNNDEVNII